jgi:hypothetical protein
MRPRLTQVLDYRVPLHPACDAGLIPLDRRLRTSGRSLQLRLDTPKPTGARIRLPPQFFDDVPEPPNGIELRRNTRKLNRRRAQRAEVKAAGVVACSELFDDAPPVSKRSTTPTSRTSAAPREAVPARRPTEAKPQPLERGPHRPSSRQAGYRTGLTSARRRRRQVAQPRTVEGATQCRRLVPIHSTPEAAPPQRTRTSEPLGGAPARRSDTAAAEHSRPLVAGPRSRCDGLPDAGGRATKPATVPAARTRVDLDLPRLQATRLQRRRACQPLRRRVLHWACAGPTELAPGGQSGSEISPPIGRTARNADSVELTGWRPMHEAGPRISQCRRTALSSGATPASRTEGERSAPR